MKKITIFSMIILFILFGCVRKVEQKVVIVTELQEKNYEISHKEFDEFRDITAFSIDLNHVHESLLSGSVIDNQVPEIVFQTKFLFSVENDDITVYDYKKKSRIIDFAILNEQVYYLSYVIEQEKTFAFLYKYVDGWDDILLSKIECNDLYNPPTILKYGNGFLILNENPQSFDVLFFSYDTLQKVFSRPIDEHVGVSTSLMQLHSGILYGIIPDEKGNLLLALDLQTQQAKEYPTYKRFGRFSITDDYIILYDENQKECVYDKDVNILWESDLGFDDVRWVSHVNKNTVVYSSLQNDLFIRDYDTEEVYKISASITNELKSAHVKFLIFDNAIVFPGTLSSNATITSIQFDENIINAEH